PFPLQRSGDDAVIGVDRLVATLGTTSLVPDLLQARLPLLFQPVGLLRHLPFDLEAEVQLLGHHLREKKILHGFVDPPCRHCPAYAVTAIALPDADVVRTLLRSLVHGAHTTAAPSAHEQAREQCRAPVRRTSRCALGLRLVAPQTLLVL